MKQFAKRFYRLIKHLYKAANREFSIFKWKRGSATSHSLYSHSAHVLIWDKPIYIELSRVCIHSFLFFHPRARIVIHTDDFLFSKVHSSFSKEIINQKVEIRSSPRSQGSWQELKIDILTSLNGSHDVFMDADLRWNGPLTNFDGIHFFVKEFILMDHPDYHWLSEFLPLCKIEGVFMLNTSFFSFGGVSVELSPKDLKRLHSELLQFVEMSDFKIENRAQVVRISEQIAFSIFMSNFGRRIEAIKTSDKHKDKSFVESSYFGATGSTFF